MRCDKILIEYQKFNYNECKNATQATFNRKKNWLRFFLEAKMCSLSHSLDVSLSGSNSITHFHFHFRFDFVFGLMCLCFLLDSVQLDSTCSVCARLMFIGYPIGKMYYVFNSDELKDGYPKALTTLGLPASLDKIDAVLVWGHNNRTYFYSGDMYWR